MPLFLPSERLGGAELTSSVASTSIVGPFATYKYLTIYACVSGYSNSAIFSLRFGSGTTSAVDTGTSNYQDWNQPTSTSTTAGTAWGTAVIGNSQSMIRLADAGITTGRMSTIQVMNRSSTTHPLTWVTRNEGSVTAIQKLIVGHGTYATTTAAQITCVQMVVTTGTLNSGTGFVVYGHNA